MAASILQPGISSGAKPLQDEKPHIGSRLSLQNLLFLKFLFLDIQIVIYPYNGIYSAIKRENIPMQTWINLEDIMLSEVSQTKKTHKYFIIPLI